MKALAVAVLGVLLLVGLVVLPAATHGPLAIVVFTFARVIDHEVARGLGRPGRWVLAMVVLVGLGAWLGPRDGSLLGVRVSTVGALAGVTMAARAVGLLLVTSAITRSVIPHALLARLGRTRARALAASVVVALRLAPELAAMVRAHANEANAHTPGILRAPSRWFEVLVRAVTHASTLADDVALEFSRGENVDDR